MAITQKVVAIIGLEHTILLDEALSSSSYTPNDKVRSIKSV